MKTQPPPHDARFFRVLGQYVFVEYFALHWSLYRHESIASVVEINRSRACGLAARKKLR